MKQTRNLLLGEDEWPEPVLVGEDAVEANSSPTATATPFGVRDGMAVLTARERLLEDQERLTGENVPRLAVHVHTRCGTSSHPPITAHIHAAITH